MIVTIDTKAIFSNVYQLRIERGRLRNLGQLHLTNGLVNIHVERPVRCWCIPRNLPDGENRYRCRQRQSNPSEPEVLADRCSPRCRGGHAEDVFFHEVGEVELCNVNPPFLWKLDEDPDERSHADDLTSIEPCRVPPEPDDLVRNEEVLEGVRKDDEKRSNVKKVQRAAHRPTGSTTGTGQHRRRTDQSSYARSTGTQLSGSRYRGPCRNPDNR